jgi:hypothetical protein
LLKINELGSIKNIMVIPKFNTLIKNINKNHLKFKLAELGYLETDSKGLIKEQKSI